MLVKSFITTTLLVGNAIGSPFSERALGQAVKCGTLDPTPEQLAGLAQVAAMEMEYTDGVSANAIDAEQAVTNVPVYVHVIAKSKAQKDGYMTPQGVQNHIKALNQGFNTTGFRFNLQHTDWTVNAKWSQNQNAEEMKKQLRKGGYNALNIYYQTFIEKGGVDGSCTYPYNTSGDTHDGCLVLFDTVNTTTTHEVGHWLGLLHTFEGGCDGDNDHIADTPACKEDYNCKAGADTCPGKPGKDPVRNYMGYTSCPSKFTAGQARRMNNQWNMFQAGK